MTMRTVSVAGVLYHCVTHHKHARAKAQSGQLRLRLQLVTLQYKWASLAVHSSST